MLWGRVGGNKFSRTVHFEKWFNAEKNLYFVLTISSAPKIKLNLNFLHYYFFFFRSISSPGGALTRANLLLTAPYSSGREIAEENIQAQTCCLTILYLKKGFLMSIR